MIEKIREILKGIDKDICKDKDGWWETSTGAEFGANKLKEIEDLVKNYSTPVVSKRFVVMYEDGQYYGSFSPLSIWKTYECAEIAENKWKQNNPNRNTAIEEIEYNAC